MKAEYRSRWADVSCRTKKPFASSSSSISRARTPRATPPEHRKWTADLRRRVARRCGGGRDDSWCPGAPGRDRPPGKVTDHHRRVHPAQPGQGHRSCGRRRPPAGRRHHARRREVPPYRSPAPASSRNIEPSLMYPRTVAVLLCPVCLMMARSDAPARAASVQNPARRE